MCKRERVSYSGGHYAVFPAHARRHIWFPINLYPYASADFKTRDVNLKSRNHFKIAIAKVRNRHKAVMLVSLNSSLSLSLSFSLMWQIIPCNNFPSYLSSRDPFDTIFPKAIYVLYRKNWKSEVEKNFNGKKENYFWFEFLEKKFFTTIDSDYYLFWLALFRLLFILITTIPITIDSDYRCFDYYWF